MLLAQISVQYAYCVMRLRWHGLIQFGIERLLTVSAGVMLELVCELRFCPVTSSPGKTAIKHMA